MGILLPEFLEEVHLKFHKKDILHILLSEYISWVSYLKQYVYTWHFPQFIFNTFSPIFVFKAITPLDVVPLGSESSDIDIPLSIGTFNGIIGGLKSTAG